MTRTEPLRAAAYVRVSTAKQADEGLSLEAQEKRVREYVESHGWTLTEVYVERGVSGRRDDRPELARLLTSLGSIDRLVIPKLDRLGRSNRHLHEIADRLQAAEVDLVAVDGSINTSTANGRLMFGMFATLAQFESDNIGERVRAVTTDRVASGKHHGRPPFGYTSENGELRSVEPAASVVRRIFEDTVAGQSQRSIARALNAEGVGTRTGGKWVQGTVSKILSNATYRGAVEVNGQEYEGTQEALIDMETWEKVAKLRAATARTTGKGRGRPSSGSHLFTSGLRLECAHCDDALIPRTNRDKRSGKTYETYECFGRHKNGTDSCPMTPVPRTAVDGAVFDYFESVALDLEAMREQLREAAGTKAREVAELLAQAERDERHAADAVVRVRRDYTSGEINAAEWRELSSDLKADHEAALAKRDRLRTRAAEVEKASSVARVTEGEAVRRLAEIKSAVAGEVNAAADVDAVRAALKRLFEVFRVARPVAADVGPMTLLEAEQDRAASLSLAQHGVEVFEAGKWTVSPWALPEVVEGVDETWRPILRREPLALSANIDAVGFRT